MKAHSTPLFRRLAAAVPNLVVLSLLIGIAYWGHTQHWRIPKFTELIKGSSAHQIDSAAGNDLVDLTTPSPLVIETTRGTSPGKNEIPESQSHERDDTTQGPVIRFPSKDALDKSGITLARVEERQTDEYVTAYGTVTYDQTRLAQLSCRVPGIVWRVEKKLGDVVKKGDILAIFDSNDVGRAKAEALEADVKSDLAVESLERLKMVGTAVPAKLLREAESEVRLTRVHRFNAQQALLNLGLPLSIQAMTNLSEEDLAERLQFLGLPPEVVSSLDPETDSANLIPLISPLDGMVINCSIVNGEVVEPKQVQFTVADVRRMWLILTVRREDSASLALGQSIFFAAPSLPGEVESKLTWIATEMDVRTRNVQVRAEIDNVLQNDPPSDDRKSFPFRANMFGTARIRVRQQPHSLVIPDSAVQWDGTRHLVFSPESDGITFRAHPVELGVVQDGLREIRSGVTRDQPIVVTGSYLLKSELIGIKN